MKKQILFISLASLLGAGCKTTNKVSSVVPDSSTNTVSTAQPYRMDQELERKEEPSPDQINKPVIIITTDHSDGMYRIGEKAVFTIQVEKNSAAVTNGTVAIRFMSHGMDVIKDFDQPLTGEPFIVEEGLEKPGILLLHATTNRERSKANHVETGAIFDVEKILPVQEPPDDFMEFWDQQKELLAQVPMDLEVKYEEKYSDEKVENYRVAFNTIENAKFRGWLDRPRGKGKYPALIRVLGGAVMAIKAGPEGGGYYFAKKYNCLTFTASVHDLPLDHPDEFYKPLEANGGPLYKYWDLGLESRESYFYRKVILGLLRSIDFLTSRDDWDGRLVVLGGSQGGAASYWMAGLDKRVTAMIAKVPGFTEERVYSTSGTKMRLFRNEDAPQEIKSRAYYDPVYFARDVKCQALCLEGLVDGHIRGGLAAYNTIPHQNKKLVIDPKVKHGVGESKMLNEAQDEFLKQVLK